VVRVLAQVCDKSCYNGRSAVLILHMKINDE
jgi:hypothetical protein